MIVPEGYELIETPAEDEPLQAGDRLELTWEIYQTGTWYWSMLMIPRVERAFEEDGRVRLNAYRYDPEAMTITYCVEVLSNNVGQTDTPAFVASIGPVVGFLVVTIAVIVNLIVGAVISGMYRRYKVECARKKAAPKVKELLEDPNTPAEVKVVLEEGMRGEETTIPEALKAASWAVGLLAGVVIIHMILK